MRALIIDELDQVITGVKKYFSNSEIIIYGHHISKVDKKSQQQNLATIINIIEDVEIVFCDMDFWENRLDLENQNIVEVSTISYNAEFLIESGCFKDKHLVIYTYYPWDADSFYFNWKKRISDFEQGRQNYFKSIKFIETSNYFRRINGEGLLETNNPPNQKNEFKKYGKIKDIEEYGYLIGSIIDEYIKNEEKNNVFTKYLNANSIAFNKSHSLFNQLIKGELKQLRLGSASFTSNKMGYLLDMPNKFYYNELNNYIEKIDYNNKEYNLINSLLKEKDEKEYYCIYYKYQFKNNRFKIIEIVKPNTKLTENEIKLWLVVIHFGIFYIAPKKITNYWESIFQNIGEENNEIFGSDYIEIYWFYHKLSINESKSGNLNYTFYRTTNEENSKFDIQVVSQVLNLYRRVIESFARESLFGWYEEQIKNHALQASSSRLINRNSAHHILSHCEQHVTYEAICKKLHWSKDAVLPQFYARSVEDMRTRYRNYVNDRYNFMAQDFQNIGSINVFFYKDIFKSLIENTLFIDSIAQDEGFGYKLEIEKCPDSKENKCMKCKNSESKEDHNLFNFPTDIREKWQYSSSINNLRFRVIYENLDETLGKAKDFEVKNSESNATCFCKHELITFPNDQTFVNIHKIPLFEKEIQEIYCISKRSEINDSLKKSSPSYPKIDYKCFTSLNVPYYLQYSKWEGGEVSYFGDNNKLTINDIMVALPGNLGAHSMYSILENHLRNLVKHKKAMEDMPDKLDIVIKISDGKNITTTNHSNKTLQRKEELYQVELFSNMPTLTKDNFDKLKEKLDKEFDLTDYDNIAKGIADIRFNAMLLSGAEIISGNPEFKTCLSADKIETNLKDNKGEKLYILKYTFYIKKPFFVAEIKREATAEFIIQKDINKGFYTFNTIEEYKQAIRYNQTPFSFLIATEEKLKEIESKFISLKKIASDSLSKKNIIDIAEIWKLYADQEDFKNYSLKSNISEPGNENWNDIFSHGIDRKFKGAKEIVFARHKEKTTESFIYERIDKNNNDFDLIYTAFNNKSKTLEYELIDAGKKRILIIDERVSGFSASTLSENVSMSINNPNPAKTIHSYAASANIDIVTHIEDIAINPNQIEKLGRITNNTDCGLKYEDKDISKYDILILHRKLVENFANLLIADFDGSRKGDWDKFRKIINDKIAEQVYINTGSGSISDLKELVGHYKYLPFGVLEKCLKNSIMKVSLLRNLL